MRVRIVAAAALAVIGVLALALAHDIRSWDRTLAGSADVLVAQPLQPVQTQAPTALPPGLSATLLSVGRNQTWLEALRSFTIAYLATKDADSLGPATYKVLGDGEAALARLTQDPRPSAAAQAYDLRAVLLFRSAYPGAGIDPGYVQSALSDLQNAIRLDPSDETAKENLELALRVLTATHATAQKSNSGGNRATGLRQGANPEPAGHGY